MEEKRPLKVKDFDSLRALVYFVNDNYIMKEDIVNIFPMGNKYTLIYY